MVDPSFVFSMDGNSWCGQELISAEIVLVSYALLDGNFPRL